MQNHKNPPSTQGKPSHYSGSFAQPNGSTGVFHRCNLLTSLLYAVQAKVRQNNQSAGTREITARTIFGAGLRGGGGGGGGWECTSCIVFSDFGKAVGFCGPTPLRQKAGIYLNVSDMSLHYFQR